MNISKNIMLQTSNPDYWESSYQSGELGWDLGGSTPIFDHWIKNQKVPLSICILGAGNGWDAVNIASKGHRVTAIDFAQSAVKNMQTAANHNSLKIDIRCIDIFNLPQFYSNHFDVVLEYTCFCAIDPSRRREYLEMVKHILKTKGELVGLLFPIDKDPLDGGPPFAVELEPTLELINKYLSLVKKEVSPLSIKQRAGREVFVIFRKDGS